MSALGHKRTFTVQKVMSALPPKSGHVQCRSRCPRWANSGHRARHEIRAGDQPQDRENHWHASSPPHLPLVTHSFRPSCLPHRISPLRKTRRLSRTRCRHAEESAGSISTKLLPMRYRVWLSGFPMWAINSTGRLGPVHTPGQVWSKRAVAKIFVSSPPFQNLKIRL